MLEKLISFLTKKSKLLILFIDFTYLFGAEESVALKIPTSTIMIIIRLYCFTAGGWRNPWSDTESGDGTTSRLRYTEVF
jgi:hypothetical protein